MPEEPTNWQGLGRLAYFAVVSGSPAKFAGVGCPGLRTGSIDLVQLACCGEVASQRHVSLHCGLVEPARLLFCVRSNVPR